MAVTTAGSSAPSEPSASESAEARSSPSSWVVQVTTLSLILGCFLGLALQAQRSIREASLPANRFEQLARHYTALKQSNENLQQEMKELRHQILTYEKRMTESKDVTTALRKQFERLQIMAGVTPVEGPGLVITLKDAPPHIREKAQQQDVDAIRQLVIHDADLLIVLNELKAAGAEAIAISGADKTRPQRIVASSAPRCA
jgi:uncharacterized protein YlxW (UPF0749 family)